MSKAAAVLVLDTTLQRTAAMAEACALCTRLITDKLIYAHSDEVGVVLAGTPKSRSTLFDEAQQARFHHITVACELASTTRHTLETVAAAQLGADAAPFDFVEALQVAVAMLEARTHNKKYSRAVYLITEASHEVARKEDLVPLIDAMAAEQVTLVVVGVEFGAASRATAGGDAAWAGLGVKEQNEAVLVGLCESLGPPSALVSPAEALASLALLRRRKIRQQPLLRVVLRIGDVRLATQLFTRAQEEKLPSLRRSTRDGVDVTQRVEYVTLGGGDGDGGTDADGAAGTVAAEDRAEAFFLGADRVPCNEADREAMRLKGPRALEAIAFVEEAEVAPYLLMGGTRTLLPLAGDHAGQRGFNALADAMMSAGRAMLVRLVRTADAAPALCVCFARADSNDADEGEEEAVAAAPQQPYLIFAPLPFADDTRAFHFSEYPELQFSEAQERLVDAVIEGLSVGAAVLAPAETFNPVLQQYYATLQAKLADSAAGVPPLLPPLRGTSADFFSEGGPAQAAVAAHRAALAACVAEFPFEDDAGGAGVGGGAAGWKGRPWFQGLTTASALPGAATDASARNSAAPSTTAADAPLAELLRGADAATQAGPAASVSTEPHRLGGGVPVVITSVDPVGDFTALSAAVGVTSAQWEQAKDDLSELVYDLLRSSVKESLYGKAVDCVAALRRCCVEQDDAAYYNAFLQKLEVVADQCGRRADFWATYVVERWVRGVDLWPITAQECASSSVADEAAAGALLGGDRFGRALVVDAAAEEDDWMEGIV